MSKEELKQMLKENIKIQVTHVGLGHEVYVWFDGDLILREI